ncbi:MAG: DNA repair exonuclease [Deltaproteobacteria bacterium]|nr:DNA repair exonuclease [Deltaproteobacteria bacterium]
MASFCFVHAADLHLDSPFSGLTERAPAMEPYLKRATFDAFARAADLCIREKAAFLILSGDVFDWAEKSLRAAAFLRDQTVRLHEHGIPVFCVMGNHDPAASRPLPLAMPENFHMFGPHEVQTLPVMRDGEEIARVSGISFAAAEEKRNLARLFPETDPSGPFHAAVLHANVGAVSGHGNYAPCTVADLSVPGVDYWALGHVHERRTAAQNPLAVYPGNTQGRSFRETGPRGCCLVRVEGKTAQTEFVETCAVRFEESALSIEGMDTIDRLEDEICGLVESLFADAGKPLAARVPLTGRGPLHRELAREGVLPQLLERVRERFSHGAGGVFVADLPFRCKPEVDLEARSRETDLAGQALALAFRAAKNPELLERIRKEALGDLFRNRDVSRAAAAPDQEELAQLLEEAGLLCLDLLEGEDP